MGHAIHFLQRIERLTPAQADLALTLYREPRLVAHLLQRIRLPDAAERVALALEDAPQSPHVIVTRDGRFVTCLGAGMAFDCPVVSRQQIDNASEKLDALRDAISREKGELKRLYDRLLDRGSAVSREDFGVLAALVPLLGNEFMRIAMDLLKFVAHFRSGFRRSRYRNVTSRVYDELHRYWTAMWAIGHLAAICGERADDVRAIWARNDEELYQTFMQGMVIAPMFCMTTPIVMRGIWTAGRVGRALLAWTRQGLQEGRTAVDVWRFGLPLVSIGLRHRRTQAEAIKILARSRRGLHTEPERALMGPDREHMDEALGRIEKVMEPAQLEVAQREHHELGTQAFVQLAGSLPAASPLRFTRAEDVPEDLARTLLANLNGDLHGDPVAVARVLAMMPWVSAADGASLYLPAELLDAPELVFDPAEEIRLLDSYQRYYFVDQPFRAGFSPGRNEPCPCGSGKKYKRCCGAGA